MSTSVCARSFEYGKGGISQVARLMYKSLLYSSDFDSEKFKFLSLQDDETIDLNRVKGFKNNKLKFLVRANLQQLYSSHFIFDQLGVARALTLNPIRRPTCSFFHGIEVWENGFPEQVKAARKIDLLITNSYYTRNRAHKVNSGFERAKVCWLSTQDDKEPDNFNDYNDRPIVTILGRLHKGRDKGHRLLIDIWPEVVSEVQDAQLHIVGSGNDFKAIQKYAQNSSVTASIKMHGFLNKNELENQWKKTWVFAMPSLGEGFGLVYVESMRHKVPIIASKSDAAKEVNLDSETGYNISRDKKSDIVDHLIKLLSDEALNRKMGQAGLQRWKNEFNFSAFQKRFNSIINEFIN